MAKAGPPDSARSAGWGRLFAFLGLWLVVAPRNKQIVTFWADTSGEYVTLDYGPARTVRLLGDGAPEALKAVRTPPLVNGKRVTPLGSFTVPAGARWVWLKCANEEEDLQGEVMDLATLREFARYTVTEAGWVDYNHYSRPGRFPPEWLKQGASPQDFILGKITDLRFTDRDAYAEAYLWPKGRNHHADVMWQRLCDAPESIHCSPGGPPLGRAEETAPDGRQRKRLRILMNHIALCDMAVNPHGTEARTAPFGEFLKAMADGVAPEPDCDGDGCMACFIRGGESLKAVMAGGPGGINAQGQVPQDIEGFKARGLRGRQMPCPKHCGPAGKWASLEDAEACLEQCHGLDKRVAQSLCRRALKQRETHVEAA